LAVAGMLEVSFLSLLNVGGPLDFVMTDMFFSDLSYLVRYSTWRRRSSKSGCRQPFPDPRSVFDQNQSIHGKGAGARDLHLPSPTQVCLAFATSQTIPNLPEFMELGR